MAIIEQCLDYGIINDNNDYTVDSRYGKLLNLRKVCSILFGSYTLPITVSKMEMMNSKYIVTINDTLYLVVEYMEPFLHRVGMLKNQNNNYILINYYKLLGKKLEGFNMELYLWWEDFKKYIDSIKNKHKNVILNIIGNNIFNGIMDSNDYKIYNVIFNTAISNFVLTFCYESLDTPFCVNFLEYNHSKIYKEIETKILLSNPDNYVVEHLSKVTKSKSFAQLLNSSHNNKQEYNIPVSIIDDNIIIFKDENMKNEYHQYFIKKIPMNNYKIIDDTIYLNFKGLNKYFLTVNEKYLINFEMKEIINEFYTSITEELIDCYKYLYEMSKI